MGGSPESRGTGGGLGPVSRSSAGVIEIDTETTHGFATGDHPALSLHPASVAPTDLAWAAAHTPGHPVRNPEFGVTTVWHPMKPGGNTHAGLSENLRSWPGNGDSNAQGYYRRDAHLAQVSGT